jgi:hypothetical protein
VVLDGAEVPTTRALGAFFFAPFVTRFGCFASFFRFFYFFCRIGRDVFELDPLEEVFDQELILFAFGEGFRYEVFVLDVRVDRGRVFFFGTNYRPDRQRLFGPPDFAFERRPGVDAQFDRAASQFT